ncbi:MAG TPA: YtxH domain-containing protein [Ardenticatenaceae bacterium]
MQNLLYTLGLKKKSRREKVQDAVTGTVHSIADSVDELVDDTRRKGPRMARRARKRFKAAEKDASEALDNAKEQVADVVDAVRTQATDAAESVGERVSDAAGSVRDTSTEARERVSGATSSATADASAAVAAAVAALASLNLDWEAILKSLHHDAESAVPEKGDAEQAGKAAKKEAKKGKEKAKAKAKKRKGRKFPGFWIWLLRLGIGYLFVERLRSRDIPAYVDHEAADQMRQQATSHPVAWYKDLLDTLFIPNASIFAAATVAAEVLAALGLLTGVNRRLSALLGLTLAGNDLLAEYQDADERSQNVLLVLAQLLLLRTGG